MSGELCFALVCLCAVGKETQTIVKIAIAMMAPMLGGDCVSVTIPIMFKPVRIIPPPRYFPKRK